MPFIKIEVEENEGYNSLIITPRDPEDRDTQKQMELLYHAIMTQQPKMGGMVLGNEFMKIDVKKEDLTDEFNIVIDNR